LGANVIALDDAIVYFGVGTTNPIPFGLHLGRNILGRAGGPAFRMPMEANDNLDLDSGPNGLQNFPVINFVSGNSVNVSLSSRASSAYTVSVYGATGACAPDGSSTQTGPYILLGELPVTTDTAGNATFTVPFASSLPPGVVFRAIAADAAGNSSNFSPAACPRPTINLTAGISRGIEGSTFSVNLVRIGEPSAEITGTLVFSGQGPGVNAPPYDKLDFVSPNGILFTLPAGVNTLTVDIPTVDDTLNEGLEHYTVSVANLTSALAGTTAGLDILDNDIQLITIPNRNVVVLEDELHFGIQTNEPFWLGNTATVLISKGALTATSVPLEFTITGGTAIQGADFVRQGTGLFLYGENLYFLLSTLPDRLAEDPETITVTMSSPDNGDRFLIVDSTFTITIQDNDQARIAPSSPLAFIEGDAGPTSIQVPVRLTHASPLETRMSWVTDNASTGPFANVGSDYSGASGVLVFPPGSTEQTISLQLKGDTLRELPLGEREYFDIYFYRPEGIDFGEDGDERVTVGIIEDDGRTLRGTVSPVVEGNSGLKPVTVNVSLEGLGGPAALDRPYNFTWAVAGGGTDLVSVSGTGSFPAGATATSFVMQVKGDTLYENDESFPISLTPDPAFGPATPVVVSLKIQNDDVAPVLSVANTIVTRGEGEVDYYAWFRLRLSAVSGASVTVSVGTADGTATAPEDYTQTAATLTLAPGERSLWISIPVMINDNSGPSETFTLNVADVAGATMPLSARTAIATIVPLRISEFYPLVLGGFASDFYVVKFQTALGQGYVIEETDQLDGEWLPVTGLIQGSGAIATELRFCDRPHCFFRVRAVASPPSP
jgi:Calx-beta domain